MELPRQQQSKRKTNPAEGPTPAEIDPTSRLSELLRKSPCDNYVFDLAGLTFFALIV